MNFISRLFCLTLLVTPAYCEDEPPLPRIDFSEVVDQIYTRVDNPSQGFIVGDTIFISTLIPRILEFNDGTFYDLALEEFFDFPRFQLRLQRESGFGTFTTQPLSEEFIVDIESQTFPERDLITSRMALVNEGLVSRFGIILPERGSYKILPPDRDVTDILYILPIPLPLASDPGPRAPLEQSSNGTDFTFEVR